jgi:hypothetical protein
MLLAPRAWSGGRVDECNLVARRTRGDYGVNCEDRSLACELLDSSPARCAESTMVDE